MTHYFWEGLHRSFHTHIKEWVGAMLGSFALVRSKHEGGGRSVLMRPCCIYRLTLHILFTSENTGFAARSAQQPQRGAVYVTGGCNTILLDYLLFRGTDSYDDNRLSLVWKFLSRLDKIHMLKATGVFTRKAFVSSAKLTRHC